MNDEPTIIVNGFKIFYNKKEDLLAIYLPNRPNQGYSNYWDRIGNISIIRENDNVSGYHSGINGINIYKLLNGNNKKISDSRLEIQNLIKIANKLHNSGFIDKLRVFQ